MICPHCKTDAPDGAKYCPRCQNLICPQTIQVPVGKSNGTRRSFALGMGIATAVALVASVGIVFLLSSRKDDVLKRSSPQMTTVQKVKIETTNTQSLSDNPNPMAKEKDLPNHAESYNYSKIDVGTEIRNGCFVIVVDVLGYRFGDKLNADRQCEDLANELELRKPIDEPGLPFTEMHLYALKSTHEIYEISLDYQGDDYEPVFSGLKKLVKRQFSVSEAEGVSYYIHIENTGTIDHFRFERLGGVGDAGSTIRIDLSKSDLSKNVSLTFTDLSLSEKLP